MKGRTIFRCILRFYYKIKFQLKLIDKMSDSDAIAKYTVVGALLYFAWLQIL